MTDQKPPSDEVMGKVVAKWKGWDFIHLLNHEDCDGKYWDDDIVYGPYSCPLFHQYKKDAAHDLTGFVFDPRHDLTAALQLWHWIVREKRLDNSIEAVASGWVIEWDGEFVHIPISGPAFRTAVCNLAVKVTGVTND